MVTLIEITAIVGAVSGSVSLAIVVYKTIKERPKLNFEVSRAYFMQPAVNDNFTSIQVSIRVDNRGGRSTTIHSATLSFKYNGTKHELTSNEYPFSIEQDSSIIQHFNFNLPKNEMRIENSITDCEIMFRYTHGVKKIVLDDIIESKR